MKTKSVETGVICTLLLCLSLILAADKPASAAEPTQNAPSTGKITSPADKSRGPEDSITVEGVFSDIPAGKHLWVVVHPINSRGYWPQADALPSPNDNSWKVTVYLGRPGDDFGEYQIILMLADDAADKSFNKYLDEGPTKKFPAVPLPDGTIPKYQITRFKAKL
ncbi:MAG: hypothetical protein HQK98_07700 [Nitrospirae bacterium]|nr:hypothetical protein [Nitrospirota bacterium]